MGYKQYEPEVLKKLQQEELVVLKEFVRICNKYDISYFAVFGTNIGIVRHHGFIPWDDDMDFGMLRDDYEKFLKVAPSEIGDHFGLAGPDCDQKFYNFVSKFYKKGTEFSTIYNHGNFEMGINLDIFVFDALAEDPKLRKKQIRYASILRNIYMIKNVNFYVSTVFKKGKLLKRLFCGFMYYLFKVIPVTNNFLCKLWKKNATKYHGQSQTVTQFNDTMILESALSLDEVKHLIELPFEDIMVKVPQEYDRILHALYGDYMQLPPLEKRQNHYPYRLKFSDGTNN